MPDMRPPPLLTDVDCVLLDYVAGFATWCRDRGLDVTGRPAHYDMSSWLGVPRDECRRLIGEFSISEAFADLPPVPGAVEAVGTLHDAGYLLVAVTSCGDDPMTAARRQANLTTVFGRRIGIMHILPLGADKTPVLRSYRPTIYLEDHVPHALAARALGYEVFVQRDSMNRHLEAETSAMFTWMDDMTAVTEHVGLVEAPRTTDVVKCSWR